MTAPTFSQIKALATNIRKKTNKRVIGVRAQGRWTGERHKQDGAETYLIEQCDSPLAMRIALRDAPDDQTIKILITNLDWEDLGEDVLLRLARGRLHTIDSWQIVKTLFQAHLIDPRLIQPQQSWIADYLIDWVPLEGYPAVSGGFLDAETVWSILLKQGIGLTDNQPDLLAILKWSTNAENIARLREAPEEFRKSALGWLTGVAGSLTKTVLNCILCNDRPDAVPIGLAIGVLFHPDIDRQLDKAIGKLEERYLGGITLDVNTASRWTLIAAECLQFDSAQRNQLLQRTDQILHEVGAEAFAYLSDNSPTGFDQRLATLGKCLVSALEEKNSAALERLFTAYQSVLAHAPKPLQEHRRLERVEMALRLVRWRLQESTKSTQPRSLAEAIAYHQNEGGFLDWARLSLRSGDQIRELSEAYTALFEQVTAIREQQAYQFAALLQNWVEVGSTGKTVLSVEHILESIVAPLASHAPVLVIVMDGMSMAVCRELVANIIAKQSWISLCQEGQTAVAAGLAAIPSTTEASRTSLLCGQLKRGRATDEKRGFASLPSLLAQCRKGSAPILFHKPSLREQEDAVLADEVRKAIASSQNRIVGVVINAIDDHLSKGDQIDISWSQDEIKALSILLHEARVSNRLVILLSDHGHIVDYSTKGKPSEGGERWRFDNSQPEKGELRICGSRVLLPDSNSLIAPWSERLRYSIKKNGYHGGLTPQEMVIPIAVLCSSTTYPTGWGEAPIDTPVWWEESTDCIEIPSLVLSLQPDTSLDFGPLFNSARPEAAHSPQQTSQWIITLLTSPIYKARKKVAGRTVPGDDVLAKVLLAMESYGGKMTLNVLSRIIGYPIARIRSLLTVIQRILNIDGYTVITIDKASDTVEINRDLLCQQFGLKKG